MLSTISGDICLLFGLSLLLLPLLAVELSRPRDGAWGALVLLLGLVLVTSSDRMRGAPMLAVLCGSLLVARLSAEVGQGRWRALSDAERQRLSSSEHWFNNLKQLKTTAASLGEGLGGMAKQLKPAGRSGVSGKKWVRPEDPATLEAPLEATPKATAEAQVEDQVEAPLESQSQAQVKSTVESLLASQAESLVEADPKPDSGPESEACEVED